MTAAHALAGRAAALRAAFRPDTRGRTAMEVELLALDAESARPVAIERTARVLRTCAAEARWQETLSSKGAPHFATPNGGVLTFEPGGQLEYASSPCASLDVLISEIRGVLAPIVERAAADGIELRGLGLDRNTPIAQAPLQIDAPRYRAMDAYFAAIGTAGARMMRQTAALQVNVDNGAEPERSWCVLNACAPYLSAMFANAPASEGIDRNYASERAALWLRVDPARTGTLPCREDGAVEYARFALAAPAMFLDGARPFEHYESPTPEQWQEHLSTMFPDVRPKGYFEIRCIDALPLHLIAAPAAIASALIADADALADVEAAIGAPDRTLGERAASLGLSDPQLHAGATAIAGIVEGVWRRMGAAGRAVDETKQFLEDFTARGLAPVDRVRGAGARALTAG